MEKQYYAYKTQIEGRETYALLPLTKDAVFAEGLYYPNEKFLLLLSKDTKEKFHIVERLTQFGVIERDKATNKEKKERVRMETNYEHYLFSPRDLEWFSNTYVINAEEFISFINRPVEDNKEQEPVTMEQTEIAEP